MRLLGKAPGKVVLSGAYSVLEGAPALVAAVDRYVTADATREATFIAREVTEALPDSPPPWFDASALRDDGQKLGLGSSAAIVVASLAAHRAREGKPCEDTALRDHVFPVALAAHRRAQGGGSGVDVAASCWGGVIAARLKGQVLDVFGIELPPVTVEVWSCGAPASTPELVAKVREFKAREPTLYGDRMAALSQAATQAWSACTDANVEALIRALQTQQAGLDQLGSEADAPITTEATRSLAARARLDDAVFLPAGAGGGDVSLYVGRGPSESGFRSEATRLGQRLVSLKLGARGVHVVAVD